MDGRLRKASLLITADVPSDFCNNLLAMSRTRKAQLPVDQVQAAATDATSLR